MGELVIPNVHGAPYDRLQAAGKGAGSNAWRILKEKMGHDVCWRDLRHVFAVRKLLAGVKITMVSEWLGHSDINLTVKRDGRFDLASHDQWDAIAKGTAAPRTGARPRNATGSASFQP